MIIASIIHIDIPNNQCTHWRWSQGDGIAVRLSNCFSAFLFTVPIVLYLVDLIFRSFERISRRI